MSASGALCMPRGRTQQSNDSMQQGGISASRHSALQAVLSRAEMGGCSTTGVTTPADRLCIWMLALAWHRSAADPL
jgi:hypothetical protein